MPIPNPECIVTSALSVSGSVLKGQFGTVYAGVFDKLLHFRFLQTIIARCTVGTVGALGKQSRKE